MTVSDEEVPGFYRRSFIANSEASKRTTPVLEAFAASRERRDGLVQLIQFASPTMIADRALGTFAGADLDRSLAYQRQAFAALEDLHEAIGPAVVAKQRISTAEFDALPPFSFKERGLGEQLARNAVPLGYLGVVSALLIFISRRRLNAPLEKLL